MHTKHKTDNCLTNANSVFLHPFQKTQQKQGSILHLSQGDDQDGSYFAFLFPLLLCNACRYYKSSVVLMCFVIPTVVPWYLWGESLWNAYFLASILRYTISLNVTWLVNSAAHMYGNRPYDKNINPRQNTLVTLGAIGECCSLGHSSASSEGCPIQLHPGWDSACLQLDTAWSQGLEEAGACAS